jgi:hypothetical protein
MLLCAINSLFENIDAEMGRLRGRVAGAPTSADCAKLSSVVQALDIRHGACARIYFTHNRKWIRSDPETKNDMDPELSPPPRNFLKFLDKCQIDFLNVVKNLGQKSKLTLNVVKNLGQNSKLTLNVAEILGERSKLTLNDAKILGRLLHIFF